jgi:uncharacterized protein (DUF4415 family)
MADKTRRTPDAREAAERAFKAATTKAPELPKKPALPNAKELVSLRIDRDVLEHFQEQGPGWQERINDVLRKAVGKEACEYGMAALWALNAS